MTSQLDTLPVDPIPSSPEGGHTLTAPEEEDDFVNKGFLDYPVGILYNVLLVTLGIWPSRWRLRRFAIIFQVVYGFCFILLLSAFAINVWAFQFSYDFGIPKQLISIPLLISIAVHYLFNSIYRQQMSFCLVSCMKMCRDLHCDEKKQTSKLVFLSYALAVLFFLYLGLSVTVLFVVPSEFTWVIAKEQSFLFALTQDIGLFCIVFFAWYFFAGYAIVIWPMIAASLYFQIINFHEKLNHFAEETNSEILRREILAILDLHSQILARTKELTSFSSWGVVWFFFAAVAIGQIALAWPAVMMPLFEEFFTTKESRLLIITAVGVICGLLYVVIYLPAALISSAHARSVEVANQLYAESKKDGQKHIRDLILYLKLRPGSFKVAGISVNVSLAVLGFFLAPIPLVVFYAISVPSVA